MLKQHIASPIIRRRHSSLFQRMQHQITKISKKLSVAKESAKNKREQILRSSPIDAWSKSLNDNKKSARVTIDGTIRRQHRRKNSFQLSSERNPLNENVILTKEPNDEKFDKITEIIPMKSTYRNANYDNYNTQQDKQLLALVKYNNNLSHCLGKLEAIKQFQTQRYKKIKKIYSIKLQQENQKQQQMGKQNSYLLQLLQYYRNKAISYRKMLGQDFISQAD